MKTITVVALTTLALLLSACGVGAEPTPTPPPEPVFGSLVSVTGEVVPARYATVSARIGGTALEVLVEPGDQVDAGDPLVRLDPTDAQLAVRRAETALEAARARLALLESRPRREDIAVADAQVEAAQAGVDQAAARLDQLLAGSLDAEIVAARAQVFSLQAEELAAEEFHKDTMECFNVNIPGEGKKEICPLLGPTEEKARFRLEAAREDLDAAQASLDALIAQKDHRIRTVEAAVQGAEEQLDGARAQLAQVKAGAAPEEIAAAEASLQQAQAALEQAQVALNRAEIRAPLAGTVGMVQVREDELVAPGQPLVTIGDLDTLRVETTDLDEIDVARVTVGQTVDVTFDALPDRVFTGRVKRISPMPASDGAAVSYTTVIELQDLTPEIRWGMTAFVDIEVEG
ncbi:MAG: efflux RND transporter periplasmic adaptor subunit [Anaerolineae bacterium]